MSSDVGGSEWTGSKEIFPAEQLPNASLSADLSPNERERLAHIAEKIDASTVFRYRREARLPVKATDQDLITMAALLPILHEPIITSHRRFLGPIIVGVKRIVIRNLNRWLKLTLSKQVELNQMTFNLALRVQTLEERLSVLEQQLRDKE